MRSLVVVTLVLTLILAEGLPPKHEKHHSETKGQQHGDRPQKKNDTLSHNKTAVNVTNHDEQGEKKARGRLYKKFGMFAAPSVALEDSSAIPIEDQAQRVGQPAQQVVVPVSSSAGVTQSNPTTELISSYSSNALQPSTLGAEVTRDQSTGAAQPVAIQAAQPGTAQYQEGQQGTEQMVTEVKQSDQGTGTGLQDEAVGTQATADQGAVETVDAGAASDTTQNFGQLDSTKDEMKNLRLYTGALPDSEQGRPQIEGVPPQEEVKVVNLGDDEKATSQEEDPSCGGCPTGAKCVNGQCQIREEDAQSQGLTGKVTTGNAVQPVREAQSISDIHELESQELKTLLKDASNADTPPPGAIAESKMNTETTGVSESQAQLQDQTQTEPQSHVHGNLQQQQTQIETQKQTGQQADQEKTQPRPQLQQLVDQPLQPQQQRQQQQKLFPSQPRFTSAQIKELRDFARMYKMYQFIRRMEERLSDPDCAPVCRKICKNFCPAKCCRRHRVNATLTSLARTVKTMQRNGSSPSISGKPHRSNASLMEDEQYDDDDEDETDEKEEKDMNEKPGRKPVLIKIVKNDVLDKPRSKIRETI